MILNCIIFPDFAFVSTFFPNNLIFHDFELHSIPLFCLCLNNFPNNLIFHDFELHSIPWFCLCLKIFSKIFPLYQNCSILFIIKKNIVSSFPTVYYSKKISFVSTISQNNVIFPDFPFAICLNSIYYNYVHNIPGFSFLCQYHFTTIWYSFF